MTQIIMFVCIRLFINPPSSYDLLLISCSLILPAQDLRHISHFNLSLLIAFHFLFIPSFSPHSATLSTHNLMTTSSSHHPIPILPLLSRPCTRNRLTPPTSHPPWPSKFSSTPSNTTTPFVQLSGSSLSFGKFHSKRSFFSFVLFSFFFFFVFSLKPYLRLCLFLLLLNI